MLVPRLSPRQGRWVVFATLAAIAALLWLRFKFISPASPSSITLTAGAADGAYTQFANRYKDFLAKHGVKLTIQTSTGSVENLARLQAATAHAGLVQSGLGFLTTNADKDRDESPLQSLATLAYEPVWIFSRMTLVDGLAQLAGKKLPWVRRAAARARWRLICCATTA